MRIIPVTPSLSGLHGSIPKEEWQQVILASIARWNAALEHCCSARLSITPAQDRWVASEDGVNLVVLRQGLWCHNQACSHTSTFPIDTLGMTTAYPENAQGAQVREADIEVNPRMLHAVAPESLPNSAIAAAKSTASGVWVYGPPDSNHPVALEAVLMHELGHVMGLRNACVTDHRVGGAPILGDCPTEQRQSVMFPDARQLQPTAADLRQLAELYPVPKFDIRQTWPWLLLLLGAVLVTGVLAGRRRQDSPHSDANNASQR